MPLKIVLSRTTSCLRTLAAFLQPLDEEGMSSAFLVEISFNSIGACSFLGPSGDNSLDNH